MSHVASLCLGGAFAAAGVFKIFDLVSGMNLYLKFDRLHVGKDTTCQKVCRLFANALYVIGCFALAVGALAFGSSMITLGPQLGFLIGLQESLILALPHWIAAFGSLFAGELTQRLGG